MESEELKLLRENNAMLKLIIMYLINKNNSVVSDDFKNFIMNVVANTVVDRRCI